MDNEQQARAGHYADPDTGFDYRIAFQHMDRRCADLGAENEELRRGADAAHIDTLKSTAAVAWGWLWHVTTNDERILAARTVLGDMLDREYKRYGIQAAKDAGARVNVHEIEAAMLRADGFEPADADRP